MPPETTTEDELDTELDEPEAVVEDEADEAVEEPAADSTEPANDWDQDRAMRTIHKQRENEKRLKAERDEVKAERDALKRERETEQERLVRERDEAKAEAEAERLRSRRSQVELAIRDAALEADVEPRKLRKLLKLVQSTHGEEIKVDSDGDVEGVEEALNDVLEEFPEFLRKQVDPDPEPEGDATPRDRPGANPDRKRQRGGEMTAKQAARLARDDPVRFGDLLAEGKIPAEALGKGQLERLKSEGKVDSRSVANEDGVSPVPA